MASIPAESDLLCETCGYVIQGLPLEGNCPECGVPIERSLPANRDGSAWQRRPSIGTWISTNYSMLRRPVQVFEQLRVDGLHRWSLLLINVFVAATLLSLPWTGVLIGDPARAARTAPAWIRSLIFARSLSAQVLAVAAALFVLTAIEAAGIRFFGTRRGWRITRNVAWQVCTHASVGWIVAAVLTLLALIVWLNISYFGLASWLERKGTWGTVIFAAVPASGFLAGLLVFESLVYLGMRRCRFANAPASGSPR
jgi:hypothetical protein